MTDSNSIFRDYMTAREFFEYLVANNISLDNRIVMCFEGVGGGIDTIEDDGEGCLMINEGSV